MYLQRYGLTLEDYPTSSAKNEVRTMYCPQCGALAEQPKKFCKSCGLKLAEHAQLLEDAEQANTAKKRLRAGTNFLLAGLFAMLLSFVAYGGVMTGAGPDFPANLRFVLALILMAGPLLWSIIGLTYLGQEALHLQRDD